MGDCICDGGNIALRFLLYECVLIGILKTLHDVLCALCLQVKGDLAKLQLTSPVCTKVKEKIALSRRVEKHWRLIGWGSISAGKYFESCT